MEEQEIERWITYKGKKIPIAKDGKIIKNKIPKINEEEMKMGDISQCALYMNDKNGNPIAYVKYMKLNDMKKSDFYTNLFGGKRIAIQMIEVDEKSRRKGYATALLKKLQSKYPKEEMRFGQLEPDGEKLLKKNSKYN